MNTKSLVSGLFGALLVVSVVGMMIVPALAATVYPYGPITVSIYGRNVTRGQSGQYTALTAQGGDTVDLIIRIRNVSGWNATNVYVTDILPAGVNYIPRSTTINGIATSDGVTSVGLGFAALTPNQEVTVKLSAMADARFVPATGRVDVANTVQVRADEVNTVSVSLPIALSRASVATVAGVKTGPADSALLSFAVAILATGIYAAYTRSGLFGRRVALAEIKGLSGKAPNFSR